MLKAPSLWCSNRNAMYDQPIHIIVRNLRCGQSYTLFAFTVIDNGDKFESFAHYKANDKGCIDLDTDRALSGSYTGNESMGLFWSMKPSSQNKSRHARMMKFDVTTPLVVTICVYDGMLVSVQDINKSNVLTKHLITESKINRWMMSPNTERIPLTMEKDGIYGTLFIPAGPGPFPGVITMFGGYRGTLEYKAALLASQGFAALALSYLGLPGLPELAMDIDLDFEYFEKAADVLLHHPKVDETKGLGLLGLSFSSHIVLLMGALLPSIKCVISLNGFHYALFGDITYKSKKLIGQKFSGHGGDSREVDSKWLVISRFLFPNHTNPFNKELDKSRIPFYDRHDVAYMFIAGLNDNNVPSEYYINQIEKLLKASKHPNYKLLRYPGAGHLIEPCYGIHHRITSQKHFGVLMDWGGESVAHCKAQDDSWKKQIEFLKVNLLTKIEAKL